MADEWDDDVVSERFHCINFVRIYSLKFIAYCVLNFAVFFAFIYAASEGSTKAGTKEQRRWLGR